jgi:ubiquinone/menaquinone biosynthesis C-methylase UbiE
MDAVNRQRDYYQATARRYDSMHMEDKEHTYALSILVALIKQLGISSVLDVGSGTGRAVLAIKDAGTCAIGIEPVQALREQGHRKGLLREELIDGDVQNLAFPDASFDLVCSFAVLHHVPAPRKAVSEMLRVAKRGVFISDANNFGQGSTSVRFFKQAIRSLGLWPAANFIKTGGKGYSISEGDGLAYSYSVFDDYPQISAACREVRLFATAPSTGPNLYRSCPQVAIFGNKN